MLPESSARGLHAPPIIERMWCTCCSHCHRSLISHLVNPVLSLAASCTLKSLGEIWFHFQMLHIPRMRLEGQWNLSCIKPYPIRFISLALKHHWAVVFLRSPLRKKYILSKVIKEFGAQVFTYSIRLKSFWTSACFSTSWLNSLNFMKVLDLLFIRNKHPYIE